MMSQWKSDAARVADQDVTPEMLADDLSQLLTHLNTGPVAVFGSSGGAVTALALAQAYPEHVHTVIAHEPPLEELLEDRETLRSNLEHLVPKAKGQVFGEFIAYLGHEVCWEKDPNCSACPLTADCPTGMCCSGTFTPPSRGKCAAC